MAEEKKIKKPKSPLIGAQTEPTTLDDTTKIDIDVNKEFVDAIVEAGLNGKLDTSALEDFTSISNSRDQIYQLIDTMMQDSSVSSIVRTYAEDICEPADNGHIVWCEANDPNISKYVNYLLNIMNVDKNIFGWAYALIEYGDVYLRLFRESDYKDPIFKKDNIDKMEQSRTILTEDVDPDKTKNESVYVQIHALNDPYSYYIEMIPDPGTMFELTRFGKTYGYIETPNVDTKFNYLSTSFTGTQPNAGVFNYRMKTNDVHVYQADDFVHACLDDNQTRYPEKVDIFLTDEDYQSGTNAQSYTVKRGKSLLYDSYKIWREKSLLENAALLNRITRSSIVRTIQVEVGDMPKSQVQNTLRRVKELMEQKAAVQTDSGMVEYTNPGAFENNIYLATHGGQGALSIGTIGGDVDVKNLADLDYWNNKFYSSYGIPKQYFGWCLAANTRIPLLDGTTPTIEEMFKNKEAYINKGILSCDKDGLIIPTTISNIMLTNEHATKLVRITLDNGETVEVTPEHKMMLRDGTFIEAKDIKVDDTLMPYYESSTKDGRKVVLNNKTGKYELLFHLVANEKFGPYEKEYQIHHIDENKLNDVEQYKLESYTTECNHTVIKVEEVTTDEPVYDLTIAGDAHTFPLAAGIFVHNCDDAAGFNGGSSLTILSSVYAKGVKRAQNALIQALTDAINLILINKGCKSYLNNFVLKMKTPSTQEEKDYREQLAAKVNAISNMQSLFADVEDKSRKLEILKVLINSLNYGDEIITVLDEEIKDAELQKAKEREEAEAAAAAEAAEAAEIAREEFPAEEIEASAEEEIPEELPDLDLGLSSEAPIAAEEAFTKNEDSTVLMEEQDLTFDENDLPLPEELNAHKDFSKNE